MDTLENAKFDNVGLSENRRLGKLQDVNDAGFLVKLLPEKIIQRFSGLLELVYDKHP